MAVLNPAANSLIPGRGLVLLHAVGMTPPALAYLEAYVASNGDPLELPAGCTPFGDTSAGELPSFDSSGGDTKVISGWFFNNFAEIADGDPRANWFVVNAIEWTKETLALFEGGRGGTAAAAVFWAPMSPVPTISGATIVMVDKASGQVAGYHVPKVSIRADAGVTLNTDDPSFMPLRFTELTHPGADGPHAWIHHGIAA